MADFRRRILTPAALILVIGCVALTSAITLDMIADPGTTAIRWILGLALVFLILVSVALAGTDITRRVGATPDIAALNGAQVVAPLAAFDESAT